MSATHLMPKRGAQRSSLPNLQLTDRDGEILKAVSEYRYLSVEQVQRLFFPSKQTTARRVRLLERAGFVSTFSAPGVQERMVMLGRKGVALLPSADGFQRTGSREPKDYLFLKHFLAITDFRLNLTESVERQEVVHLLGFIPEYRSSRGADGKLLKYISDTVPLGRPGETLTHTPDGVFALERDESAALFALEVDRGTEVISTPRLGIFRLVEFYLRLLTGEGYQRYQQDFGCQLPFKGFRALLVTTSEERLKNIREVAERIPFEPRHAKRFIWISTFQRIAERGVLNTVWDSLDPSDSSMYAIAGTGG
jgi:hypothetical protein